MVIGDDNNRGPEIVRLRLGIPHQYLRKCPSDLQAENINHWIEKVAGFKRMANLDHEPLNEEHSEEFLTETRKDRIRTFCTVSA